MRLIDADAFDERVRAAGGMSEEELTEDFKDGVQAVLYMLSNQPTIHPEPHWIPCSAELPKTNDPVNIFNRSNFEGIFGDFSPSEAVAKLKAYEEKQKASEEIKVGDEVEVLKTGSKYLIAWISGTIICGFSYAGITCRLQPSDVRKTGRHFDIDKILEKMRT